MLATFAMFSSFVWNVGLLPVFVRFIVIRSFLSSPKTIIVNTRWSGTSFRVAASTTVSPRRIPRASTLTEGGRYPVRLRRNALALDRPLMETKTQHVRKKMTAIMIMMISPQIAQNSSKPTV